MATTLSPVDLEFKYKLSISWRNADIDFLGLPSFQDGKRLSLNAIYVSARLLLEPQAKQRQFLANVLKQHKQIVVLGDPGSGKSALIQMMAYSFGSAGETPLERAVGAYVPIPIWLRDYNVRSWQTAADMLRDYTANLPDDIRSLVQPEWLLETLRTGRGALLIDGLDEVGSADDRRKLRDQILLPLLAESKDSLAVITSRAAGYDEAPLEPVTRFYLAPFGPDEIQDYVLRWYSIREQDANRRQDLIRSLHAAIKRSPQTAELAQRPGMLAMMALIHRATGKLPPDRLRLYDQIVAAYLESIQSYRKLPLFEASLEQMKRWLAAAGWEMQLLRTGEAPRLHASRRELIGWLKAAIGRETADPERFLDYVLKRSGLLIARSPDEMVFAHLSFQEYFAAWRLRGDIRRFEELCRQCAALAGNDVWHETLVFLFEMLAEFPGAGDDLLRKMIESEPAPRSTVARLVVPVLGSSTAGIEDAQELGAKFIFTTWLEEGFQNAKGLAPFAGHFAERFGEWAQQWLEKNSQILGKAAPIRVINAMVLLGRSLISLGDSVRAARVYDAALAFAENALADFGGYPEMLHELGFVLDHAGTLMRFTGRTEQARQYFQRSLDISERLSRQMPDRADYLRDLSVSYEKLGDVALDAEQLEQARELYQQAFEIRQRLANQEPNRAFYLRDLSVAYNKLGDVARQAGQTGPAQRYYQRAAGIRRNLASEDPSRTDYLRDLAVSYKKLGDMVRDSGQAEEARQNYQQAFEICQRLANQEPDRADYLSDLSQSCVDLGDVARDLGQLEQARQYFEQSLEIRHRLANQEPYRADYLRDLAVSYGRLGNAARDAGQTEQARQYYQQSLEILQSLATQKRDLPGTQIDLAACLTNLGGKEHLEQARAIMTALRDKNQLPPNRLSLLTSIENSLAEFQKA